MHLYCTSRKEIVCSEKVNVYLIVGMIVFVNVIKDLSWVWEPRKIRKMSSIKRFQK